MFRVWGLLIFVLGLSACTGSLNDPPEGAGSIKITPGQNIQVDLQDIFKLGVTEFTVTLRTLSDDYSQQTAFYDVTPLAIQALSSGSQQFTLVLPKSIQRPRPYLVVVELPELQEYVVDALFDRDTYLRPGLAAKLAYDLLDSYDIPANPRPLASYSRTQFRSIQAVIQEKIDLISSQSETLSPNTVNFARLMRFYKNSMAFNPTVLSRFKDNSVHFAFDTGTIQGVNVANIPDDQTADDCFRGYCYKYAKNFRVVTTAGAEVPATDQPFKHNTNSPAQLQLGATLPLPSSDLSVEEKIPQPGEDPVINVRMEGYDLDDDYMEKVARVKFTPRALPTERMSAPGFPFKPEKTPEMGWWGASSNFRGRLVIGTSGTNDSYQLDSIESDEALNPAEQLDSNGNPLCSPNECRTAAREIHYLISDGMAWLPYRWRFAYTDRNRKPQFVLNANNGINSTVYDQAINALFNEAEIPGTNGWRPHASTCESDPNDSRKFIKSRADSPWSCAFVMFDPDLDEDPNGAPDQFFVSAYKETDILLVINFGARLFNGLFDSQVAPLRMAWPPTGTATVDSPGRFPVVRTLDECDGHRKCGAGLVQLPIDNAVKVAAESQSDQTVSYDIKVFDRPTGGQLSRRSISRKAEFVPQPPFLINFASTTPTPIPGNIAVPALTTDVVLPNGNREFIRGETYLGEIIGAAKPSPTANPNDPYSRIGFLSELMDNDRLANRTVTDLSGQARVMNGVIHQPFSQCLVVNGNFVDINGNAPGPGGAARNGENCRSLFNPQYTTDPLTGMIRLTNFTGAQPVFLGNSLRSMTRARYNQQVTTESPNFDRYSFPRESDLRCSVRNFDVDNLLTPTWDQRAPNSDYLSGLFATPTPPPVGSTLGLPTPTPSARTPLAMPGVVFEINAIDYDNLDLLAREPSDPIFITLTHDLADTTRISFCHPPAPNIDSRIGETYLPTNPAGDNGVDPDSCSQWSSSPPARMQPIPVFYRGLDENNLSVPKKLVYHRLRVMWTPADQGHEKKFAGRLDPPGVIRNALKGLRLHGNLYQNQSPPKSTDKTELVAFNPNLSRYRLPLEFYAQKQNFAPCLSGTIRSQDINLHQENQDSGKIEFSVSDSDRVNQTGTGWDGTVSGVYEAELALLGNNQTQTKVYPPNSGPTGIRNLFDPELVKWVPHIVDCGAVERRPDLTASKIQYRIDARNIFEQIGQRNLRVRYTMTSASGVVAPEATIPVAPSNDPELSVSIAPLPPYSTVSLSLDAQIDGNWVQLHTGDRLQANPSPTPFSNSPATEGLAPAIWYSSDATGNFPRIRLRSLFNPQGSQMCVKTLLKPAQDVGETPFIGVWRISRTNPADTNASYELDSTANPWLRACTGRDRITLDMASGAGEPAPQHLLVGVKDVVHNGFQCAPNLTTLNNNGVFTQVPQTLLSGGGLQISLIYKIDYSSPIFGNLSKASPSPSPMNSSMFRLDWFPQIFERTFQPIVTKQAGTDVFLVDDRSSRSALHFQVNPLNLYSLDVNPNSPTFGLKRFVGFNSSNQVRWTNTHDPTSTLLSGEPLSVNVAPRIPPLPNARREHDFAIRAVDFDSQLKSIRLVSPLNGDEKCQNSSSFCVRKTDDRGLELITWAPTPGPTATPALSSFVFKTSDHVSGGMETDPYDVHTYQITTPTPIPNQPNPIPVQTPSLAGVAGRASCTTGPANYPNLGTLDSEALDPFKKCTLNWITHATDAGKTFNYEILTQDNLGANPSATPVLMGIGGRHPIDSGEAYIDFNWTNQPFQVTDFGTLGSPNATFTQAFNTSTLVSYTVNPPDTNSACRQPFFLGGTRVYEDFMTRNTSAQCMSAGDPANDFISPGFNPAQAISPNNFPSCICHSTRTWVQVPAQQCDQTARFCRIRTLNANQYLPHEIRIQQQVTSNLGGAAFAYVTNPRYQPPNPYTRLSANLVLGTADSYPVTNSPLNQFKLKIIALERNNAPYFLGSNQSALPATLRYTGSNGTAWDSVFPGGVFPSSTCLPTNTPNFDCASTRLSLNAPGQHFLASSTPRVLDEVPLGGPVELFEFVAEDVATTLNLRKLRAVAPTRVLVLGPPGSDIRYSSYSAPSFAQSKVAFTATEETGTPVNTSRLRISFKWAPTDEEAFYLSNSEGFLIPIVVEDDKEDPSNNDPSFSQNFVSQKLTTTLWIWCKLRVLNQSPMVFYRALDANKNPTGPKYPLAGATLQFQTGSNNRGYVILTEDKDVARYFRSASNSTERTSRTFYPADYFPTNAPIQASASPSPTPPATYLDSIGAPTVVIQQFVLNAAPNNSQIGLHSMSIKVTDPGDPARGPGGLTVTAHPNEAERAGLPGSQSQTVSFNLRVVGKPTFLAPAQEVGNQYTELQSASLFGLTYPLSLNLTRPEERSDSNSSYNFFMGIVVKPSPPPGIPLATALTGLNSNGFAVNERYLLTLGPNTFGDPAVDTSRLITIGAVADQVANASGSMVSSGYCSSNRSSIDTSSNTAVTLQRLRSNGTLEFCNLSSANAIDNLAQVTFRHTVVQSRTTVPTLLSTSMERQTTHAALGLQSANEEYRDFQTRCLYCSETPVSNGIAFSGGEITGYLPGGPSDSSHSVTSGTHSGKTARFIIDPLSSWIRREISDTAPTSAGFLESRVQKGESLKFRASLSGISNGGQGLVARWYVNGCLKAAQPVTTQSLEYSTVVGDAAAGLNNDCSGQYERAETSTALSTLGYFKVTLRLANGSELLNSTPGSADGSPAGYDFILRVVNTSPAPMLAGADLRAVPITNLVASTSTYPMKSLLGFTHSGLPMFAYVEQQSSSGNSLRIRSLTEQGTLRSGTSINLSCNNLAGEVSWIGINTVGGSSLQVSLASGSGMFGVGLNTAYPVSALQSVYASQTHTCYHGNISGLSANVSNLAGQNSVDAAARTLAFGMHRQSSRITAMLSNGAGGGHLIDQGVASSEFWNVAYPMIGDAQFNTSMFAAPQPELSGYPNNAILKNLVLGQKLIQLIGADPGKSAVNIRGFITVNGLTVDGRRLNASSERSVDFSTCDGFDSTDTTNNPTPIDAIYHPASDTLFVIATDTSADPKGYLAEVRGLLNGAGACRVISKATSGPSRLEAPSRFMTAHNTSVTKLTLDSAGGILYGVISKGAGMPGQVFSYDFVTRKPPRAQTLSFAPTAILYTPSINAVHVLDGTYSASPLSYPALYRIW